MNWALELNDFDFDIVHIPSTQNQVSDFLSRVNLVHLENDVFIPEISCDEFISEQRNDEVLKNVFEFLDDQNTRYDLSKLGAFKRYRKHLRVSDDGYLMWKNKIVIPRALQSTILQLCHDNAMSGHFGVKRTVNNFIRKYFWPAALSDARKWVLSCDQCNKFNQPTSYNKTPLQSIPSKNVFET